MALPLTVLRRRLAHQRRAAALPAPRDFRELARAWGLEEEGAAERAARETRLRLLAFVLAGLLGSLALAACAPPALVLAAAVPALLGAATSLWRLSVLRSRRLVGFWPWLLGRPAPGGPDGPQPPRPGPEAPNGELENDPPPE
jgi:hypothetical protein